MHYQVNSNYAVPVPAAAHAGSGPAQRLPWTVLFGNATLFVFMATSIFYVFPSGLPQPADMLLALAMLVSFAGFVMQSESRFDPVFLYAVGFGAFTFLINIIHFVMLPDLTFMKSSFYYIYNTCAFIFVISLFRRTPQMTWKAVYYGLICAIALEFFVIEFFPNLRGFRQTGTFYNPNQLAVWALIAACMLVILKARQRLSFFDLGLLMTLGYMQTLALSKAGLVCFGLLMFTLLLVPALTSRTRVVFFVICVLLSIYGVFESSRIEQVFTQAENIDQTLDRLMDIGGEADDSIEGRGYTRILEYPEFLIFGAGEGGYFRFSQFTKSLEMHSGIGTILFCYGIIGFGLFSGLLYFTGRRNSVLVLALIGILFLYGLTHQNVRFRHFWIFLGVCYVSRELNFAELGGRKTPPRIKRHPLDSGFSST